MADLPQPALSPADAARLEIIRRLIPTSRLVLVIAIVAIAWKVLDMMGKQIALLQNAPFMTFVGVVAGSTLTVIVGHYFGGTQAGSAVMAAQSDALIKSQKTDGGS